MSYAQLNINQRINAKANALIFYTISYTGGIPLLKRVSRKDPNLYLPQRMYLEPQYMDLFQIEPKGAGRDPKY